MAPHTDTPTIPDVGTDSRSTDSVCRFRLPYPIAALYQQRASCHRPGERLAHSYALTEGVVRFLAYVQLADAMSQKPPKRKAKGWLGFLERPGIGKLLGLHRSTTGFLADWTPFVPEMAGLLEPEWQKATDDLNNSRIRFAHDHHGKYPDKAARAEIEAIGDALRTMLEGVLFLQRYALGVVHDPTPGRRRHTFQWYAARGLEEHGRPVELETRAQTWEHAVLLVDRKGHALPLDPLIRWMESDDGYIEQLMWLQDIPADDKGARYLHPVRTLEQARDDDPELFDEWSGGVDLQLTDEAVRRVRSETPDFAGPTSYRHIGLLGRGGMGEVHEAFDEKLGRPVALKLLRTELLDSSRARRRFQKEARALAKVRHPRVVEIYEVGETDAGTPFIAMACVEGEDLQRRIERTGPLPPPLALGLLDQALEALVEIHAADLVHRDLKPSNFILAPNGLVVIDFGIAGQAQGTRLTGTMDRMGSRGYTAPEQEKPRARPTPAMDIYGAGCLLYALLAGQAPDPHSLLRLDEALPGIGPALRDLIRTATAYRPEERFESAAAFRSAIASTRIEPEPPAPGPPPSTGHPPEDLESTLSNPHYSRDLERLHEADYEVAGVITEETIVIVTGGHPVAELLDRPAAEYLRDAIDPYGDLSKGRRAIVVSDLWFHHRHSKLKRQPQICVGGPGINSASGKLGDKPMLRLQPVPAASVWGADAVLTAVAVDEWIDRDLPAFLDACWPDRPAVAQTPKADAVTPSSKSPPSHYLTGPVVSGWAVVAPLGGRWIDARGELYEVHDAGKCDYVARLSSRPAAPNLVAVSREFVVVVDPGKREFAAYDGRTLERRALAHVYSKPDAVVVGGGFSALRSQRRIVRRQLSPLKELPDLSPAGGERTALQVHGLGGIVAGDSDGITAWIRETVVWHYPCEPMRLIVSGGYAVVLEATSPLSSRITWIDCSTGRVREIADVDCPGHEFAVSADGSLAAVASASGHLDVVPRDPGAPRIEIGESPRRPIGLTFSPAGAYLASLREGETRIHRIG